MTKRQLLFDRPLPDGWQLVAVGDIKAQEPYSCVAGPFGSNISSKYFVSEGVPVIRGNNLRDDLTSFVPHGFAFVSEERAKEYRPQHVKPGDLVFTCWGTLGQVGLIPQNGPYLEYIISNKQLKLRPNRRIADPRFLFYYFASPQMVRHIRGIAVGAAVPGINLGILKSLQVALPPMPNQERIVSVLATYDELIENNRRRIKILEEMARAIYREWFVYFRFPGRKKVKMVTSPLGSIPEGWARIRLGQVADVNALSIERGEEPDQIAYVDISSVSIGSIQKVERMEFNEAPGRARRIARHGDIIWSMVRPNRRSYSLILDPEPGLIVSTGFAVISARKAPFTYLYHALTTDAFVSYLANRATGAAYPAVKAADFEQAEVLYPSKPLLERFHETLEPFALLREALARKNSVLSRTRDLLLPKLISGEVDVSELDIKTGDVAA